MVERNPEPSLVSYTHVMYALHALAAVIGIFGSATVIGQFVFGLPSIVAVIMNYARRSEARGTWLESHFSWQLATFWYAVLWGLIVIGVSAVLMIIAIGFLTLPIGIILIGLWITYRVLRGWLALRDGRPVP
jgi:uncharacterized membrane protein